MCGQTITKSKCEDPHAWVHWVSTLSKPIHIQRPRSFEWKVRIRLYKSHVHDKSTMKRVEIMVIVYMYACDWRRLKRMCAETTINQNIIETLKELYERSHWNRIDRKYRIQMKALSVSMCLSKCRRLETREALTIFRFHRIYNYYIDI